MNLHKNKFTNFIVNDRKMANLVWFLFAVSLILMGGKEFEFNPIIVYMALGLLCLDKIKNEGAEGSINSPSLYTC